MMTSGPLAKYPLIAFATIVDVERAKRFYRDTLGLTLISEEPPASTPEPSDAPVTTFLEALKDQLGMKLEPTRAMVKVLVVDSLERPTEN